MVLNLFEYKSYREYLIDLIESLPNGGRGQRKILADGIQAQVSYVSAVLSGAAHFSVEQAEAVTRHYGFNLEEAEFFLLLVQYERAGTAELRKFFQRQIANKKSQRQNLKTRLKMPESLKAEQEARYYSSWHYSLVHVALSIPDLQYRDALTKHLKLPLSRIDEILQFLEDASLVEKHGTRYVLLKPWLHLEKGSPLIAKHHINWRTKTILNLDMISENDLHYSSVLSLSEKDYPRVKELLGKALEEAMKIITVSNEEKVAALCLDFYAL